MKWLLIIFAVHINNPSDIPARISIGFENKETCEQALNSITYWLKFNTFKVVSECKEKS